MIYDNFQFTIPEGLDIRVITNTDAKNEADDQFCIVQTLLSPRFDNRGIIAAHYGKLKTPNSMEESYKEVIKILDLMEFDRNLAYKGAPEAMPDEFTPVPSPGAQLIIDEAMKDDDRPLFITFLGPLTDLASAYLIEPRIAKRLTCIWIGGNTYPVGGSEYNLSNDIHAANVVFKSEIPVWQIPRNAYKLPLVSFAELELKVRPYGKIGEYLFEQLIEHGKSPVTIQPPFNVECWCLGDSPATGVLLFEHLHDYEWMPAPEFGKNMEYIHTGRNRPIRVYKRVDFRFILDDFYAKLALFAKKQK